MEIKKNNFQVIDLTWKSGDYVHNLYFRAQPHHMDWVYLNTLDKFHFPTAEFSLSIFFLLNIFSVCQIQWILKMFIFDESFEVNEKYDNVLKLWKHFMCYFEGFLSKSMWINISLVWHPSSSM